MNQFTDSIVITPKEKSLSIQILAQDNQDKTAWKKPLKYKLYFINEVPVLFIWTADGSDRFFTGINFIQLQQTGSKNWLVQENLQFDISLRNQNNLHEIISTKKIRLNKEESEQTRTACLAQNGTSEFVDPAFEFLYNHPTEIFE